MRKLLLWEDLAAAWQDGLSRDIRRTAWAFLLIWGLSFGAGALSQPVFDACSTAFSGIVGSMAGSINRGTPALFLFLGNLQSASMIMLYGVIPFLKLGALSLGVNAALLGWTAAYYVRIRLPLELYFAALLPHAVFELPALVLALGISLYACEQVTRRLRGDLSRRSWFQCLSLMGELLLFPIVPLLLIAACVEAYVTPSVAALFLSLVS